MSEAEIQGTHKEFNIQEVRQLIHFFRIKKIFRGYEENQGTERFAEISVQMLKCLVPDPILKDEFRQLLPDELIYVSRK